MRYMQYGLGIMSVLLLFFLWKGNDTAEFSKTYKIPKGKMDSLDQKALLTPLYEEYLRVKFDHCTP